MKAILLIFLVVGLLLFGCEDLPVPAQPGITLESRIAALEKRVSELESQLAPNIAFPPAVSLEERVKSLESLVKSEPWKVRENPYFSPSIEERLSHIEEKLGINDSRLWP